MPGFNCSFLAIDGPSAPLPSWDSGITRVDPGCKSLLPELNLGSPPWHGVHTESQGGLGLVSWRVLRYPITVGVSDVAALLF